MLLLGITTIAWVVVFRWPKAVMAHLLNLAAVGMLVSVPILASKGMYAQATLHGLVTLLLGAMGYVAVWARKTVHGW